MSLDNITGNIISDFLVLLIGLILGWLILTFSRRKLLTFYGVHESRRMIIYLSNLRVVRGGAVGIDGRLRSYEGAATAFLEMLGANRFRDLFNFLLPTLSESPGFLSKLLISDVQVQLAHSPLREGELERSFPFIALGSPAYNVASRFVEEQLHSRARFRLGRSRVKPATEFPKVTMLSVSDTSGEAFTSPRPPSGSPMELDLDVSRGAASHVPTGSGEDIVDFVKHTSMGTPSNVELVESGQDDESEEIPTAIQIDGVPDITDTMCGFVERIVDIKGDRFVFYVAGISELATAGAAHFLRKKWSYLRRKYPKDTPFLVVLRFDANTYKKWNIVFEL